MACHRLCLCGRIQVSFSRAAGFGALVFCAAACIAGSSTPPQSIGNEKSPSPQAAPTNPQAGGQGAGHTPLLSRVDLIPIRVVVRDKEGHVVADLKKEDFRVSEDRKEQDIAYFSVQTTSTVSSASEIAAPPSHEAVASEQPAGMAAAASVPAAHFVAFLFDDVHIALADLSQTRTAAMRFVDSELQANDRVGVFTISGQSQLDFTDDRKELDRALLGLSQHPLNGADTPETRQCPTIDYYQADLIVNHHDTDATNVAVFDALRCAFGDDLQALAMAREQAMSTAERVNSAGEATTRIALRRLDEAVRTMAAMPGQRSLVLLSPGFICPTMKYEFEDLINEANRLDVFIDTLDAAGVYTADLGDAGMTTPSSHTWPGGGSGGWLAARDRVRVAGQSARFAVLDALAGGTGGRSLHENDFGKELSSLAEVPTTSYLIAFTPHDLKYDGKFHSLKVTLTTKQHANVQARRGFYDPLPE